MPPPGQRRIRRHVERDHDLVPVVLAAAIDDCVAGRRPWPLFVYGGAGVGKTCAALCLCDRVSRCAFYDLQTLCEKLLDAQFDRLWSCGTHAETLITARMIWEAWRGLDLGVIDELGVRQRVTDHQYDVLKRAIDFRYNQPLVLVSNLDVKDIGRVYDDRISSRLAGGTVVKVEGQDQRLPVKEDVLGHMVPVALPNQVLSVVAAWRERESGGGRSEPSKTGRTRSALPRSEAAAGCGSAESTSGAGNKPVSAI